MDRKIVYAGQQPTASDMLNMERAKMIALGYLAQGVIGTNTIVDGLACTPTSPATLAIQIGAGQIYQTAAVDTSAYSSLPIDTVDQIVKQGIALSVPNLTLTPPILSGQAVNYLIEAQLLETDTGSTVLPYFNSSNPLVPYSGPNGSGVAQPTIRSCTVSVQAKAGVAATAGSQVTPSPDAGWVGLWVVTVANGATQITSANISQYASAPFISLKLPNVPLWVQNGSFAYASDTGTANALSVSLTPTPTAPPISLYVRKIASANTGAMNITIAGVGTYAVLNADTTAIASGGVAASYLMHLVFDGTSYRFMNSTISSAVGALTASSGEGINVNGSSVVALNFPALSTQNNIASTDLIGFYSQGDAHHRSMSWSNLLSVINNNVTPQNIFSASTSGNGWIKFQNGLIVQWVSGTETGAETTQIINFPIAFPTACLKAIVGTTCTSANYSQNVAGFNLWFQTLSFTRSGITVFGQAQAGFYGYGIPDVIAIGY